MKKLFCLSLIVISIFIFQNLNSCGGGGGGGGGGSGGGGGNGTTPPTSETGTLTGTVTDSNTNNFIQNATVSVQNTALSATTNSQGEYTIDNVPAGTHTITARASGYSSQTKTVNIVANTTTTLDFSLSPSTTPPGTGRTFYVATNGSNENPGTREAPWATPGYGSRQLDAGDTLVILGGRYILSQFDDDIIIPQRSGTQDKWITIKGEDGNRPVLAGRDDLVASINLSGRSYIRIENIEITSDNGANFREGIQALDAPISNIVIKNVYIHHIDEFGIDIGDVNGLQIIDSQITYCGFGSIGGPPGEQGGWRNVLIDGCSLSYSGHYYQGGPGPSIYDRPDGFGIEPSSGPIEIRNTIAEHNRGDGFDSKAENTYIHHCVVANNSCDGVKLWGNGSKLENTVIYGRGDGNMEGTPWAAIVIDTEHPNSSFTIANVTLDDVVGQNYVMYVQYDHPNLPTNLTVINTIFSARGQESPIYLGDAVNFTMKNNLFYMPQHPDRVLEHSGRIYSSTEVNELGAGNIYGDPLFVQTGFGTQGDYHLRQGSPGIDAGTSAGAPSTDLEGKTRPQGAGYDIGAYEK